MFDLDLLRCFIAVVDTGGFTRAADRVNRSQSTVSQQIRRLEEGLGRKLLDRDRSGGSVSLTEEGELLLGYARRLIGLSVEAQEAVQKPGSVSIVRLGAPEDFAGRRLADLLSGFSRQHPQIRLDTFSGWSFELRRLLDSGDLDLCLIKREVDEGRCIARWPDRPVWVAGQRADLAVEPIPLALFPQGCIYRRRAVEAFEASGRQWRIAFVGQGVAGVQAAIAAGIGVGLLCGDEIFEGHRRLEPAEGFVDPPAAELALVGGNRHLTQSASLLADFIRADIDESQRL